MNRKVELRLYTDVVLTCDLPEHRLRRGDVVKVVDQHTGSDNKMGYSIEILNALGETIAFTTVPANYLEPLRKDEVLCARPLSR